MRKKVIISVFLTLALVLISHQAILLSANKPTKNQAKETNIVIQADLLEADNNSKTIKFSGNVIANTRDFEIHCKTLLLYSREANVKAKTAEKGIEKIVAEGNVVIMRSLGEQLEAEKAVFFVPEQRIQMTGNPQIRREEDVVKGEVIDLYLKDNRVKISAGDKQKVKAVIRSVEIPEGFKEGK